MEPDEAYARFVLDKLSSDQIVALANTWLEVGIYADSLGSLCVIDDPIMSDVAPLFSSAMEEMSLSMPNRHEAAVVIIEAVMNRITAGSGSPVKEAAFLYHDIHGELSEEIPDRSYLGDNLGLEHIFCWLREIWDCRDGSMLLYHTDLPRDEAELKFIEHLRESAAEWLQKKKHNKSEMATPRKPSD